MGILYPQKPEYINTSGAFIKRWRTTLGLKYEDVAEALGVDPITVRNWEKRKILKRYVRLAFEKAFLDKKRVGPEWYREAK